MSVRREKRRDPKTGAAREFWMVDVDLQHPDGRRTRIRKVSPVPTRRGAEQYERELRQALAVGTYREEREVLTFKEFVEEKWWPTYPKAVGNRATTVREKEIHLRVHLLPVLGTVKLDQVRGEVVHRLFAELHEKGLAPKTRKNVRATLRRLLASAVEWGYLEAVPLLPKVKVPESPFDFFTPEESELLVGAARSPEERALLLFPLRTGARAGEQLALEWGDVDWHSRKVILRRSSTRGVVGPTKSGRERKVPLTAALEAALKAMRHLRGSLVFCNPDGRPLSLWQLHERLWSGCRRAGLRKIRWHDLRHSFASQLMMAGVPIRQVQEWMGHATITMTMRYAHLAPGGGAELIGVLDERQRHGNLTATEGGLGGNVQR